MLETVFWIIAFWSARTIAEIHFIESPPLTKWGDWYDFEQCPYASYVYGFQLKVHEFMNSALTDDTTLNGIYLLCSTPDARRTAYEIFGTYANIPPLTMISSKVGGYGELHREWQCSSPHFAIGFELMALEPQGIWWDDTAANNLILYCSGGESIRGDGIDLGIWTGPYKCRDDRVICGIQTQVEFAKMDDTALNNVRMGCCEPIS